MSFDLWMVRFRLWLASRPGKAHRALGRPKRGAVATPRVGVVRVAAVQMRFRFLTSAGAFARTVSQLVNQAAAGGAELVVFPEDVGMMLFGILPRFERITATGSMEEALARIGPDLSVSSIVELVGKSAERIYLSVFSRLARDYGMMIQAGSMPVMSRDGRVYNIAYLFGPRGQLMGTQLKCHLLPLEAEWGFAAGDELVVLDTPIGRVAQPICMDATYFETFRILSAEGAEVVCLPVADPDPSGNPFKSLRGLWPRVQESGVYGIQSCMVGSALDLTFTGRSGIYAPLDLTPTGDGVLAQALSDDEEIVLADLDMDALRAFRKEEPIRANAAFIRAYFPAIYRGFWRGGASGATRR